MFLLLQTDIGFLFVFVKQALFPYVSFTCVCRFCKQMLLVYRQAVRPDEVIVTANNSIHTGTQQQGQREWGIAFGTVLGMSLCGLWQGSSLCVTTAFCASLRMLITHPCYVRTLLSLLLPRLFLCRDGGVLSIEYKKQRSLHNCTVQNQSFSRCNWFIINK